MHCPLWFQSAERLLIGRIHSQLGKQKYWVLFLPLLGGVGMGCGEGGGFGLFESEPMCKSYTSCVVNEVPMIDLIQPDGLWPYKPGPIYIELLAYDPLPAATANQDLRIFATMSKSDATGVEATVAVDCASMHPATSGLYTCTSLNDFEEGEYVFRVTAEDTRGATSDPVSVTVSIINEPPLCTFITPGSGTSEYYEQGVPTVLILTCEDPDGGTAHIDVEVNSDQSGFLGVTNPSSDGTAVLQVKFPRAGVHTVTATATDYEGGIDEDSFIAIVASCEDFDNDGFNSCIGISDPPDCDDEDATSNPDQVEFCNGKDSDCDGLIDNVEGGSVVCE